MFSDFKDIDGGVVYMCNNNTCKTEDIGSVNLKMFQGSIRKLNGVRYIPGLKMNLSSLGGILEVARGALAVIQGT